VRQRANDATPAKRYDVEIDDTGRRKLAYVCAHWRLR
jgi:hypothetical protein